MNIDVFLRTKDEDWRELSNLMRISKGKLSKLDKDSILKFGTLYRSACADLAYARREFAGDAVQKYFVFKKSSGYKKSNSFLYHRDVGFNFA